MTRSAEEIARDVLARRAGKQTQAADAGFDGAADAAGAMAVQDAIEAALAADGTRAIGYKVGATNQKARDVLGSPGPFRGRLYDTMSSPSGASVARPGDLFQVWEVEVALRIGRDLDPADAPFDAAVIEAATAAVLPAIEIVGSFFRPFNAPGLVNILSDMAAHGHWVHGAEVTDWSGMDLMEAPITLSLDGEVKATGKGAGVDGGAFASAAWLANDLAASGRGLKAGDMITTGSVTPLIPVGDEREIVADFGALGKVTLTLG